MAVLPVTLEFARLSPDDFVRGILAERLACDGGGRGGELPVRPQGGWRRSADPAGRQAITAADPIPNDLRQALDAINRDN